MNQIAIDSVNAYGDDLELRRKQLIEAAGNLVSRARDLPYLNYGTNPEIDWTSHVNSGAKLAWGLLEGLDRAVREMGETLARARGSLELIRNYNHDLELEEIGLRPRDNEEQTHVV
jgi:hypothetical protein